MNDLVSVALVVGVSGHVLAVTRRNQPEDLCLPGGKADAGEAPHETLIRELREETGVVAVSVFSIYSAISAHRNPGPLVTVFYVDSFFSEPTVREAGIGVCWVPWGRMLDSRNTFAPFYRGLDAALDLGSGVSLSPSRQVIQ